MTPLLLIPSNQILPKLKKSKNTKMNQLTEAQLKQKTKAQLIDGFLKLNRKVNKVTQVSNKILPSHSQKITLQNFIR